MRPLFLLLLLLLASCGKADPEALKSHLSGYWEIEKVLLPDGSEKVYTISTTIDYIELDGDTGLRKKVQPQLDGSYTTFDQNEQFSTVVRNDSLILKYSTPFSSWEETVLEATETKLLVQNSDGKRYLYKAYQPISIDE